MGRKREDGRWKETGEKNPRVQRKKAHVHSSGGSEKDPVRKQGPSADVPKVSATFAIRLLFALVEATVLQQRSASISCHATSLGSVAVACCIQQSTRFAKFALKAAKSICRNNGTTGAETMMRRGRNPIIYQSIFAHSRLPTQQRCISRTHPPLQ